MATVAGAHVFRDVIVTIDEVDYQSQVSKARLVPTTPTQTYRTVVPNGVVTDVGDTTWAFELAGLQVNIAGGLAEALRDAAGTEIEVVLQPQSGFSKPTATFAIVATSPPFGGEEGNFLTIDMTFDVQGAPVFGTSAAS